MIRRLMIHHCENAAAEGHDRDAEVTRPFERLLGDCVAVCFEEFFSPAEVRDILTAFYGARARWTSGFGGEQFALGEVWYHYRETGGSLTQYQACVEESLRTVEAVLPGLYDRILSFLGRITAPEPVTLRPGWAGPGIVNFPAGEYLAHNGGDIHYDWDGLQPEEFEAPELEAYSFVSMLSKPERAGGLTLWNARHDNRRDPDIEHPSVAHAESVYIDYQPGQLWVFRSMWAHCIEPFGGSVDRVCLTFHVVRRSGCWLVWF